MKPLFTYPREVWNTAKCEKIAKRRLTNTYGDKHPWPGLIAGSGSSYPEYGQTIRYNGGTIIDGEHYESVHRPLPQIPDSFHFVERVSWGTYLEKKVDKVAKV